MAMIIDGSNGATFPNSTLQFGAAKIFRTRILSTGTTYTVPSDVRSIYVFVCGATGGKSVNATSRANRGGPGYSETFYATPAASYTYAIGAAGASTPTDGGTTSFGAMTVTGGGAVTGNVSGGTGGVGSGGTFNASGGAGGLSGTSIGGTGGAGSRAGNGGIGGGGNQATGGGGGGTGGNNASGATPGAAGTLSGSAISLSAIFPSGTTEVFDGGTSSTTVNGGDGASSSSEFNTLVSGAFYPRATTGVSNNTQAYISSTPYKNGDSSMTSGVAGVIMVVEVVS